MSLLSKLVKSVAPAAAAFGKFIPGIGTAVSLAGTAATAYYAAKSSAGAPAAISPPMPSLSAGMFPSASTLGRVLPGAGAVAGRAVGYGVASAKRVYNAAASYCRRHPQWCSTIGGIAAVEAMIGRGELPVPKRRRGKGISATELKNFRRVARFTSQYCAPVRRAMTSRAVRRGGKSCQ